jgi:hypothetical protein
MLEAMIKREMGSQPSMREQHPGGGGQPGPRRPRDELCMVQLVTRASRRYGRRSARALKIGLVCLND